MNIPRAAMLRGTANGRARQKEIQMARVERLLGKELSTLSASTGIAISTLVSVALVLWKAAYGLGYQVGFHKRRTLKAQGSRLTVHRSVADRAFAEVW